MDRPPTTGSMSVDAFCAWASIGRTKAYEEITAGRLVTALVGRRRLIPYEAAARWLQSYVEQPQAGGAS